MTTCAVCQKPKPNAARATCSDACYIELKARQMLKGGPTACQCLHSTSSHDSYRYQCRNCPCRRYQPVAVPA